MDSLLLHRWLFTRDAGGGGGRSSIFGAARPREEILRAKGVDYRKARWTPLFEDVLVWRHVLQMIVR